MVFSHCNIVFCVQFPLDQLTIIFIEVFLFVILAGYLGKVFVFIALEKQIQFQYLKWAKKNKLKKIV